MKRPISDTTAMKIVERLATDAGSDFIRFVARRMSTASEAPDFAQEAHLHLSRVERKELIRDARAHVYRIASNVDYRDVAEVAAD